MNKFYEFTEKIAQFLVNIMFVIQIILLILVFLTSCSWICSLLNINIFDFASPIADTISEFISSFINTNAHINGTYIDISLLIFDTIAVIAILVCTKIKAFLYKVISIIKISKEFCRKAFESSFNKDLQHNVEKFIKINNKTAILVQFKLKNMYIDSLDSEEQTRKKEQEIFTEFHRTIKALDTCEFAKSDDKMLILIKNFEHTDSTLATIDTTIRTLRKNLKKEHWLLTSYIGVEAFSENSEIKNKVYPTLEKLLSLKHKNEAICFSNFQTRYDLLVEKQYAPIRKGKYNLGEEIELWTLVKKN